MMTSDSIQSAGLCSTCNNSPVCFYRARRGPALHCEMFDNYVALPVAADRMLGASAGPDIPAADDSSNAGLCVNCENRRICNLPKLAGGVWHCENYE